MQFFWCYISGIARSETGERLLILLDVNKILGIDELKLIKAASEIKKRLQQTNLVAVKHSDIVDDENVGQIIKIMP